MYDLDEAIEEFYNLKQVICQLDSKRRQLRTEKQSFLASMIINPITQQTTQTASKNNDTASNHTKKSEKTLMNKFEKNFMQMEKKRMQLKQASELCSNKLRSGKHLGQDRLVIFLKNCFGNCFGIGKTIANRNRNRL